MNFTTTQLDSEGIPIFRQLLVCFGREFDEPKTYLANQPSDECLAELLGGSSFIAMSAFYDGKVVGGLAAYEIK